MKKWKQIIVAFVIVAGLGAAALPAPSVSAVTVFDQCKANAGDTICKAQGTDSATSMIKKVVNTLLYILGAIAVIMIVVGGIRYALSGGDASGIKGAKDTIIYASVGLVVAVMAFSIVNFVITSFK